MGAGRCRRDGRTVSESGVVEGDGGLFEGMVERECGPDGWDNLECELVRSSALVNRVLAGKFLISCCVVSDSLCERM